MAEVAPTRNDIAAIFKRLRAQHTNKVCFDCNAKLPTWASVTYGVFICIDCSAIHRSLGVHVSFVRSTNLDTNWTWLQLRMMQVGGNANAMTFFQQHNCTTHDAQQKYNSRAAQLYREKVHHMAVTAMRTQGTKLYLESSHENPSSPEKKEVDFFQEHNEVAAINQINNNNDALENGSLISVPRIKPKNGSNEDPGVGPNVEAALSSSPTQFQQQSESRKPTIGMRTSTSTKKGFGGAKKLGLGAQKLVTNFTEIEQEANVREQAIAEEKLQQEQQQKLSKEEEEKKFVSMRLAYQDLSMQQQKEEDKMRRQDPKKASQMERLGMGFSGRRFYNAVDQDSLGRRSGSGITHSATSDMKTIEQESPNKSFSSYGRSSRERDYFDDDFEFVGFSSGPPKYGDNPFMVEERFGVYVSKNDYGSSRSSSSSTKAWDSDEPKKSSSFLDETIVSKEPDDSSGRSRRSAAPISSPSTDDAQKKFGNAKAISSEQYFGGSKDLDYERKSNLARFEGSNSISSADYFGDGSTAHHASGPAYSGPDLDDIREGVRAGVTKVAGKLSSLANGVMNSLQDRYGN